MIKIKGESELKLMREAGNIVALAHKELQKVLVPGVSSKKIDQVVEKFILSKGATPSFKGYGGFPASACISINEELVHGIPSKMRTLKEGDIVSIDIGANYKGYHGDSAWTYQVGDVSKDTSQLLNATKKALLNAIEIVKPGIYIQDIAQVIEKEAKKYGYSVPLEYSGHGVGTSLHEDPLVPNFDSKERGAKLKQGMVIAIEPMFLIGKNSLMVKDDNWTVCPIDGKLTAHYEHTVAVTKDGYKILTAAKKEGNYE